MDGLFETRVNILDLTSVKSVERDMSADMAAKLLLDLNTHCLLLTSGSIVTPWDIVMKGLRESKS